MPIQANAWRCMICGYVHRGPEPPEACPVCGAPREEFEPLEESATSEPAAETVDVLIAPAGASDKPPQRVVMIGAGGAGLAAVEALRAAAPEAAITLVSREAGLPYYRLNLTRYLAGEIAAGDLPMHPASWYSDERIDLLLAAEASRIDLAAHTVELTDGRRLPFDKLLLAAGATPFVPPIPGANRRGVSTLRTTGDAEALLAACRAGERCVVIGGGILGMETAGALARQGADVTLLESHGWLMPRQLNARAGTLLGAHAAGLGIKLRTGAVTREILGDAKVCGVLLADESEIPAEQVVIATGVRPEVALAKAAGLEVKQGVVVDNYLQASHRDVFAAGDVAEHQGMVYGLWVTAQAQGSIAGMNLAGGRAEFGGLPRSNSLKTLGLDLFSIGQIAEEPGLRSLEAERNGRYFRFVLCGSRLVGAILLGDARRTAAVKRAVEEGRECDTLLSRQPTAEEFLAQL